MRLTNRVAAVSVASLLAGCSAYSSKPTTTILPTSNRSIDVVLHRGDVRLMDCATLAVLQTYSADGRLIDSKEARGSALHCTVIPALIDAGGRVGAAAAARPAVTTIKNAVSSAVTNSNSQSQSQLQWQNGSVVSTNTNTNTNTNTAAGGAGGTGGTGGNGGQGGNGGNGGHGNNGNGNGTDDGTNPGSDNHHDNGDNS